MEVRAAYIRAPWQCELRRVALGEPKPGWFRMRVEACGICGSDLGSIIRRQKDWGAVGHEVAGVVEALGENVTGLAIGQRVTLQSSGFCGSCAVCRDGRVDLCTKAPNFWGQPALGMSDAMLVPAGCAVPYEGLSPAEACQAEPAGVAFDLVQTADIRMGQRVCVIGPGPIGLVALALARHRGAAELLCVGTCADERRLALAAGLGAVTAVSQADDYADLKARHRSFDHVLMTAPTRFLPAALQFLAYGGTMTFIGLAEGDATVAFNADDFHFRKLQLRASFAAPAIYFPAVLRLMRAGILPARTLVSHTFPLAQVAEAFLILRDQRDQAVKVVVTP